MVAVVAVVSANVYEPYRPELMQLSAFGPTQKVPPAGSVYVPAADDVIVVVPVCDVLK
jgi:hypothetical protein